MDYMREYARWLDSAVISPEERAELEGIRGNDSEIKSRFYAPLEFGTAGQRGVLGAGINRMNLHTVRQTTQALARLVCENGAEAMSAGVAVCFDCRMMSAAFAREAAMLLAGNGIKTYLFDAMRPTPEVSFAIRHLKCTAGINITASHNPKEYNGYKVYWSDGAQLPPAHADVVARGLADIDVLSDYKSMPYDEGLRRGLINIIGAEIDEAFLDRVLSQSVSREAVARAADTFKVVYTPFHGTGYKLVPEILRRIGLKHILCEPEQMKPDGTFPTVKSPNPEDKAGFTAAIELARRENVDLIIGTDPDADRVGIVLRTGSGDYVTLSGNQVGVLLLDYILTARRAAGTLPENAAVIKTVVTTEMARAVAVANGVHIEDTFTGFKFIAERIKRFETEGKYKFIFGYEESYGYMAGDHCRDKDAVAASMLIAEMAACYSLNGVTLFEAMERLYEKYGFYGENTVNLVMQGLDGLERMKALMARLRSEPPADVSGTPVVSVRDYLSGEYAERCSGKRHAMELSGSNVLQFDLKDGTKFIVRPSGTEPKIKVYVLTRGSTRAEADANVKKYTQAAAALGG